MGTWITVDPENFSDTLNEPRTVRGVNVKVYVSPYDIPVAVRGRYDQSLDRFVIEFKYVSEEPLRSQPREDGTEILVGKRTGRIYAIRIDIKSLKAKKIGLTIESETLEKEINTAISRLPQSPTANARIAESIISSSRARLFGNMCQA